MDENIKIVFADLSVTNADNILNYLYHNLRQNIFVGIDCVSSVSRVRNSVTVEASGASVSSAILPFLDTLRTISNLASATIKVVSLQNSGVRTRRQT